MILQIFNDKRLIAAFWLWRWICWKIRKIYTFYLLRRKNLKKHLLFCIPCAKIHLLCLWIYRKRWHWWRKESIPNTTRPQSVALAVRLSKPAQQKKTFALISAQNAIRSLQVSISSLIPADVLIVSTDVSILTTTNKSKFERRIFCVALLF